MSLESGTYISDLNANNPTGTDKKKEGDDHIRLLKSTIKASFPNIDGAMTATDTELNYVVGVTSSIQTQLDGKADSPIATTDVQFTTTNRILARDTAGAGAGEEVTASAVLNMIGSAAQGDILYRGASDWAYLTAGTSGQYLKTQGAGANPTWSSAGLYTSFKSGESVGTSTTYTVGSIPSTALRIDIVLNGVTFDDGSELRMQLGYGAGSYATTGYTGTVHQEGNSNTAWSTHAILDKNAGTSEVLHAAITLTKCNSNIWHISSKLTAASRNSSRSSEGYVDVTDVLDAIQFSGTDGGSFSAGTCTINYLG